MKLLILLLVIFVSGCANTNKEELDYQYNLKKWKSASISNYSIEINQTCECVMQFFHRKNYVTNGRITKSEFMEDVSNEMFFMPEENYNFRAGDSVPEKHRDESFTIESLFSKIGQAFKNKASKVKVTYDPIYGFPRRVFIDYRGKVYDEELILDISNFEK